MKYLLLIVAVIGLAGCGSPVPGAGQGSTPIAAAIMAPLKQSLVCLSNGTDGYLSAYSIQYTLNTYADNTRVASCEVKKGQVTDLNCPSSDPFSITYTIIETYTYGQNQTILPYKKQISETFSVSGSNCNLTNY